MTLHENTRLIVCAELLYTIHITSEIFNCLKKLLALPCVACCNYVNCSVTQLFNSRAERCPLYSRTLIYFILQIMQIKSVQIQFALELYKAFIFDSLNRSA